MSCLLHAKEIGNLKPAMIHFNMNKGLPSNQIYCLYQDKKGYIWIATDRGLCKFDGYKFETFSKKDGLLDMVIFDIFPDHQGRLWFLPMNNKIFYYEAKQGFVPYRYNNIIQSTQGEHIFNQLLFTPSNGLFLISYKGHYLNINTSGQFFIGPWIPPHISSKKNRTYWTNKTIPKAHKKTLMKYKLMQQDKQRIYLKHGWAFLNKPSTNKAIIHIPYVKRLSHDRHICYNKKNELYIQDKGVQIPILKNKSITHIIEDDKNGIWISTLHSGLYFIPPNSIKTTSIHDKIISIIPTKQGVDLCTNKQEKLQLKRSEENCHIIIIDEKSDEQNLSRKIDITHDHSINFNNHISKKIPLACRRNKMFSLYGVQKINNKLFQFDRKSLYIQDRSTLKRIQWFGHSKKRMVFEIMDSSNIWIGTYEGLKLFDWHTGLEKKTTFNSIKDRVQDIKYLADKKTLAVATIGNGLFLVKENRKILHFTKEQHGLLSNNINNLFIDPEGQIWIATSKGVNKLIEYNGSYKVLQPVPIIDKYSKNITQICQVNGTLYIGTDQGLYLYELPKHQQDLEIPVFMKSVWLNSKKISKNKERRFSHFENNIKIKFGAISFLHLGAIEFRYRLKGLSNQWIHTWRNEALFWGLSPGNYEFELEAHNGMGKWFPLKEKYTFNITPAFWNRLWFKLVLIVGVFFIILWLFYRSEQKNKLLRDIYSSREEALSAQLKPHFIFNVLSSIQYTLSTKGPIKSREHISRFSKLLRVIFENSKKQWIPLAAEIKHLENYIDIESIRFHRKIIFQVQTSLDLHTYFIPPLLLQPIIENTIQHGFPSLDNEDSHITIDIKEKNSLLHIRIEDNGRGLKEAEKRKQNSTLTDQRTSSGLNLVKTRLRILSKTIKNKTRFSIEDNINEEGTIIGVLVQISIPILNHKQIQ